MPSRILIVEDDMFLAKAYHVKLSDVGFAVDIAANGEQALEMMEMAAPNLIVLDLIMPKKDGFATLTDIKAREDWRHIPVIVVSNVGEQASVDRVKELGAIDFITKSNLLMSGLVGRIQTILK